MFLMGIHNAGCQNMHLTTRPATKRKKKVAETNTNAATNAQMNRRFLYRGHIHRGALHYENKDKKAQTKNTNRNK